MNLTKHFKFFDPINDLKYPIHIIGCGAVGSNLAEMLTRIGVPNLHLYDMDTVSSHNITNQIYTQEFISEKKTTSLNIILKKINPIINITLHDLGYNNQPLAGYIFLCVDNIDLRRKIITNNIYNCNIKAVFDFRIRLTDAQHYAVNWQDPTQIENLLNTMNFSHEEAKQITPTNACGTSMSIISTIKIIVGFGLSNFINFVKKQSLKNLILINAFDFSVDVF